MSENVNVTFQTNGGTEQVSMTVQVDAGGVVSYDGETIGVAADRHDWNGIRSIVVSTFAY